MLRTVGVLLLLLPMLAWGRVTVDGVRTWAAPDHTRVVFDLSAPAEHEVFTLSGPDRVVIDLEQAAADTARLQGAKAEGLLKRIRSARRGEQGLRVVLDVGAEVAAKSFLVKPNGTYGHRLVIDLRKKKAADQPVRTAPQGGRRELVIAIDAGHGGEDPGAIGKAGTYEKDVVLGVARKLAALIQREPGMSPLLIRTGDYYVGLRDRTRKARQGGADMFISIHADAVETRSVKGSSVYTLSRNGASTEAARLLAARENSADLIGGVSLEGKDDLVASVLVDLSRAATVEASVELADRLLGELGKVGRVHKSQVEHAGFVVLKNLDIPSVLVELAFISNPSEEKRLRNPAEQRRLAQALMQGLRGYAEHSMPPPGLRMAGGRQHVVRRGDTLSGIAQTYSVSLQQLRSSNSLVGDDIRVGTTLMIP
ncbi:N-acetylmuramoyl-L-alanine amidase [Alkalilimnicola sp. S0819]|uniref:N-acetylmuramoyl-L-alanine amidase n=1 Tax=Alkalilimnicola sp. S0819 TaxID=2613922 RepID=UPI0012627380|nr:N-acetylmuramoyl-L-alanine amidase [Alkalilimnicola sp. S0819]KAB7628350.1 AMIN domain-containing protein [Alkalilimnicola sp. S0819]MPQ15251.1 AMIN domain-containing protein [Alkalilimnicola sp. S0819]